MTTNLSGSLSEFSLAEVLSLLGMGGRTARMQVTSPGAVGTVNLVDGRVSSASSDSARAGLLRAVVAALPVPADDLAHALHAEDPVRALVESGVVDRDAAHRVAAEHCTEAVGEMLGWSVGEFAVWVGSQDPSDIGVRLEVDDLVGAARERAQEWADLRAALPESDTVLALVPDVAQAPVVEVDDWAVLARVDGRRTLAEVLAAMGAAPLAAGNRLVQLMARGLVAVRVDGGDAELEHANQLLDSYEGGGSGESVELVGTVEVSGVAASAVEVAADVDVDVDNMIVAEPDTIAEAHDLFVAESDAIPETQDLFVAEPGAFPEVHDLFVTEPEAVEEWQDAAGEAWVVAEPVMVAHDYGVPVSEPAPELPVESGMEERIAVTDWAALVAPAVAGDSGTFVDESLPAEVEPRTYELEPVDFATEAVAFDVASAAEQPGVEFDAEPVAYVLDPVDPGPVPEPVEVAAVEFAPATEAPAADPVALAPEPVADPVAESFAWSPWAQEMGLGEAPAAAPEPEPAPFGFGDMVEDAAGHGHTEAFPVPQSPVSGFVTESAPEAALVPASEVDQFAQFVPQPRDPGDGVVDPAVYAQAAGAHAAHAERLEAPAAVEADAAVEEPHVEAPDPLAGGLLAHLMSSVRGL